MSLEFKPLGTKDEHPVANGRMTRAEARGVIALWTQERTRRDPTDDLPTVGAVADSLDISEDETAHLLDEVRRRRSQAARAHRRRLAALSTIGLVAVAGLGAACDLVLHRESQGQPPFEVIGSQLLPAPAAVSYLPGEPVTRADIRLKYHPPSLKSLIFGPEFRLGETYLLDGKGHRYSFFKIHRPGQAGITQGWWRPLGGQEYKIGFAFPLRQVPPGVGSVTFNAFITADGKPPTPISVTVRRQ